MTSYLFLFGRTPELSFRELQTLFPQVERLASDVARAEATKLANLEPRSLIGLLGGTVKVAELVAETAQLNPINPSFLGEILAKRATKKKIVFGLSYYGENVGVDQELPARIKKQLMTQGFFVRYIQPRQGQSLTSVVVDKGEVIDLILVRGMKAWFIGRTVAVQPFADWNRRDRGRPFADPKAGMLPLKVARMVVNLARPQPFSAVADSDMTLLDPFCGMGTILAEALLTGWQVIGSDQSDLVLEKAQQNLAWLGSIYPQVGSAKWRFLVSEATHVSEKLAGKSLAAVVTEPFMGSTQVASLAYQKTLTSEKIKNMVRGLEKLYLGCLKDWYRILRPEGKVVIALPKYNLGGKTYFVKKIIDTCEKLGYTTLAGPLEYSRPQAVVRREFFVFQKH